jgi:hypothetical protein
MDDNAMSNRKSGQKSEGRNPDGTFAPGNPGKPKGTRHRATRAVETLVDGSAEAITQKAVDMALEGDSTALRLCMERIAPPRKDAPVNFDLPKMSNAQEASIAASGVLKAVSEGQLTPLEAVSVMGLIENFRRVLETTKIEDRLAALEARQ